MAFISLPWERDSWQNICCKVEDNAEEPVKEQQQRQHIAAENRRQASLVRWENTEVELAC